MNEDKAKRITYFLKDPVECPVCETSFYKEDLLSGSGRLIAGNLTEELRRMYEPSKKFGELFPLNYVITVCPECFYAVYSKDFMITDEEIITSLTGETDKRKDSIGLIFKDLDFTKARGIREGVSSFYLAIMCYDHFPKNYAPAIKQGVSCLRAAWLFNDLHRKEPNENYDYLSALFYRKARFFYTIAIEKEQTGKETMSNMPHLGPDLDKNYGYDGVLYITGLLEYKYGSKQNTEKRVEYLNRAKQTIARVHGMGKASKSKPSAILEKVKDLYTKINEELKELKGEE
jgi:uncharacterized protein (DUF2225 family)